MYMVKYLLYIRYIYTISFNAHLIGWRGISIQEVFEHRCVRCIRFHVPSKMWSEITHPFPNFNASTVEVREWISNFIPQFIICDCFSMLGLKLIYVSKRGSGSNDSKLWRYFRLFWHAIIHVCAGNLINPLKWTAFGIAIILMGARNIL